MGEELRAILISTNEETGSILFKILKAHFNKIELKIVGTLNEALEDITNIGAIEMVFIDANDRTVEPREVADGLTEVVGAVPKVFVGNDNNVKSRAYKGMDVIEEREDEFTIGYPFKIDIFKEVIEEILSSSEEENFANSILDGLDSDFLPLRVRNFYMYDVIPFDAFIKLTKGRYALILQQGKSYSHSYLHGYVKKQVRYFYLSKDDHIKALEDLMGLVSASLERGDCTTVEELVKKQLEGISLIQEYLKLIGITDQVTLMTKIVIESIRLGFRKITKEKQLLKYIDVSANDSAQKSMLTFRVCESLVKGMGWESDVTRMKLGLCSIIHDCTIPNDDLFKISDLNDPNLSFFTEEEQDAFKVHPQEAAKLAFYFNDIPEVDYIIGQHHELPNGKGFPNRLNANTITSLSAIFILSNNFVSEIYRTKLSKVGLQNIAKKFKDNYDKGNFKEPLKILFDVMKYDIL